MTGSGQRSSRPVTSFNLGRSATSGVVAHGPRASRRARPRVSCAAMLQLTALLLVAQIQLPAPRGYVNDFAGVLDSASVAHMEAVITEVRAKTRGEIAVVTLSDIADRPAADVALEIGRRWGVGAKGEAGDPWSATSLSRPAPCSSASSSRSSSLWPGGRAVGGDVAGAPGGWAVAGAGVAGVGVGGEVGAEVVAASAGSVVGVVFQAAAR